jgi:hypothetical protein
MMCQSSFHLLRADNAKNDTSRAFLQFKIPACVRARSCFTSSNDAALLLVVAANARRLTVACAGRAIGIDVDVEFVASERDTINTRDRANNENDIFFANSQP